MMNNTNNDNNSNGVGPYRATSNMNTYIDTPNANFNGMMNVNIQNTTTNNNQNVADISTNTTSTSNASVNVTTSNTYTSSDANVSSNNSDGVVRTYVSSDNKPKKKTVTLNLGPEFKIAFLIVVILLVFVFLLPYISELIRGY
jgi:hypothetical protein